MTIPQNTAQFEAINKLVNQLGATFTVEHSHTSKSITLPVPTITMPGLTFMLRDNFHDLNLYVRSDEVLNLPLSFFYTPQTFQWYQGKILSKRAYSFAERPAGLAQKRQRMVRGIWRCQGPMGCPRQFDGLVFA